MRLDIPYTPHPGQELFHRSPARFRVLACGARWGKDRASVCEAIRLTVELLRLPRPRLIPRVHGWFVTPNYPLAQQLWRELKEFTPPQLLSRPPLEKDHRLEWKGGAVMEIKSADDPQSLVAVGLDWVVLVEAGLLPNEAWDMALRPRLASPHRAGLAIFNGTPKGRNRYHQVYLRGLDPGQPDWESWNFPTAAIIGPDGALERHPYGNPHIALAELEQARREMPDRWFRQEFLAEFLSGDGAVFRNVRDRLAPAPASPKPPLVAGVDLAKRGDFSVFAVFDAGGRMVALDRMSQASYPVQAERLVALLQRYDVARCVIESNGPGEPFYDNLLTDLHRRRSELSGQPKLIPYVTTAQSKRQMIDALTIAFERGQITLLPDEQLVNEFEAFSISQTAAGNKRFATPQDGFDDCVTACALAWTELTPRASRLTDYHYPTAADASRLVAGPSPFRGIGGGPWERWR